MAKFLVAIPWADQPEGLDGDDLARVTLIEVDARDRVNALEVVEGILKDETAALDLVVGEDTSTDLTESEKDRGALGVYGCNIGYPVIAHQFD